MANGYKRGAGLLALMLLATACGSLAAATPSGAPRYEGPDRHEAGTAATPALERQGALAPRFSLKTIDAQTVAVPDGSSPTILYFLATDCLPCLRGTAELDALHREYADRGLRVLAIDLAPLDRPSDLASFRDRFPGSRFLWAMDAGQQVTRSYKITSLDATVFVGPGGEVLFRSETYPDFAALRRAVQQAVGP